MEKQPFQAEPKSDEESAVLESYYYVHNAWITPQLLLQVASKIRVPVLIVHGRYDMNCPISSAFLLKGVVPQAKLLIPNAGHAMNEKHIFKTLRKEIGYLNNQLLYTE
jgi:proline iminopeptidase